MKRRELLDFIDDLNFLGEQFETVMDGRMKDDYTKQGYKIQAELLSYITKLTDLSFANE